MRKLFLALGASLAFAVAACGPGGADGTTGPTMDPGMTTDPGMTDPLATPGMTDPGASPTDGMTMEPTTSP